MNNWQAKQRNVKSTVLRDNRTVDSCDIYSERQKYLLFAIPPPGALNVQRRPERSGDTNVDVDRTANIYYDTFDDH